MSLRHNSLSHGATGRSCMPRTPTVRYGLNLTWLAAARE